jgi:hypothetical protein
MLRSVEEQILSLFTVRAACWLDAAKRRKCDFVIIYGPGGLLAWLCTAWKSRFCRYLQCGRALGVVSHCVEKQILSLFTVRVAFGLTLRLVEEQISLLFTVWAAVRLDVAQHHQKEDVVTIYGTGGLLA